VGARLRQRVAEELGKPFAPSRVVRVAQLPKTRSAKIMRRAVRAAVLDADPGDLSGAENPEAVEQIRLLVKELPGGRAGGRRLSSNLVSPLIFLGQ
jgi:acetyl-CoA synthetase